MTEIKNLEEKMARVEAVLFVYGEPLAESRIAKVAKIEGEEIKKVLDALEEKLGDKSRGVFLVRKGESCVLATKPEFADLVGAFVKEDLKEELTPASVETLSLIAYFAPVSRAQIDFIRGVNSSFILRNLLIRGLVERKSGKGNMYLYEPTFDFLKQLGVKKAGELPDYEKYRKIKETHFTPLDYESSGFKTGDEKRISPQLNKNLTLKDRNLTGFTDEQR